MPSRGPQSVVAMQGQEVTSSEFVLKFLQWICHVDNGQWQWFGFIPSSKCGSRNKLSLMEILKVLYRYSNRGTCSFLHPAPLPPHDRRLRRAPPRHGGGDLRADGCLGASRRGLRLPAPWGTRVFRVRACRVGSSVVCVCVCQTLFPRV